MSGDPRGAAAVEIQKGSPHSRGVRGTALALRGLTPAFLAGFLIPYAIRLMLRLPAAYGPDFRQPLTRAVVDFFTPGSLLYTPIVLALVDPSNPKLVIWPFLLFRAITNGVAFALAWQLVRIVRSGHRWVAVPLLLAILAWAVWTIGPPLFWSWLGAAGD